MYNPRVAGQSPVEEPLRTLSVFATPLGLGQRRTAPTATPRVFYHLSGPCRLSDTTRYTTWRPGLPFTHLACDCPTCWQTEIFVILKRV